MGLFQVHYHKTFPILKKLSIMYFGVARHSAFHTRNSVLTAYIEKWTTLTINKCPPSPNQVLEKPKLLMKLSKMV